MSDSSSDPCYFEGYAYVNTQPDAPNGLNYKFTVDQQTISASNKGQREARQKVYHDPGFKLTESEVDDMDLTGLPIKYEHLNEANIGQIIESWRDGNKLCIRGRVDHPKAKDLIRAKMLASLSIAYDRSMDRSGRMSKPKVNEVSIVRKPFFEGCDIVCVANFEGNSSGSTDASVPSMEQLLLEKPTTVTAAARYV